jgi:hypothetical protein
MSSSDYGNENPAMHHKVEGNEMIDYSVIDQSPAITDFKQVAKKILFYLKNIQQLMEEERKGVQDEIDKEKRVSPVVEVKVYFGDLDQLDQHVAVALDGEEENETKKQEYCSVIDVSTVKDPEQVMAMVVEKKEKITKIIIQVSVSPPAIVMDVEEEEKDEVEEEDDDDDDDDDEIKKKGWVVLDDGWDSDRVVEDPEEYTRCLRYEPKGRRDLLLYYNKFASASKVIKRVFLTKKLFLFLLILFLWLEVSNN